MVYFGLFLTSGTLPCRGIGVMLWEKKKKNVAINLVTSSVSQEHFLPH